MFRIHKPPLRFSVTIATRYVKPSRDCSELPVSLNSIPLDPARDVGQHTVRIPILLRRVFDLTHHQSQQPGQIQQPAQVHQLTQIQQPAQQNLPTISRLLTLPPHIRTRIFTHAFSISTIYVNLNPWSTHPSRSRPPGPSFSYFYPLTRTSVPFSTLLSSTAVSKQFHSETQHLPYTLNTFEVYLGDIDNFIMTIPSHIADSITTLKVEMYQLWCLREYEGELHWLDECAGLKKVVVVRGGGRRFSGLERCVKRAVGVYAQTEVEVESEMADDVVDRVVGRRRLR
jgi:hypothetical protein